MRQLRESKIGKRGVLYCRMDVETVELIKIAAMRRGETTSRFIGGLISHCLRTEPSLFSLSQDQSLVGMALKSLKEKP